MSDFSGWGNDDKGETMVMNSGGERSGGGGGRITQAVLAIGMVLALVLAGYSMYRLDGLNRAHAGEIETLKKAQAKEVDGLKADLVAAGQTLREDRAYVRALEADNECIKRPRPWTDCPEPPVRTERQKYIDDLKAFNVARRRAGSVTIAPVAKKDPFPPERR